MGRLPCPLEAETAGNAAALCEQLRMVLEPTLRGRLQGDFKTGKRINLRKARSERGAFSAVELFCVRAAARSFSLLRGRRSEGSCGGALSVIPYIASNFRRDKIWLRRTKPSKREFQLILAVDNSKSMAEMKARGNGGCW